MKICIIIIFVAVVFSIQAIPIFADEKSDKANAMYVDAAKYFAKGQYKEAISIYDKILQDYPDNASVLKMRGVAESNLGHHQKSLADFYKTYQKNPKDVVSLLGLGVGFGNFGEYQEAKKYFDYAHSLYPDNIVAKNYKEFADKTIKKYPYRPTEKPKQTEKEDVKAFVSYVNKVSATVLKEKRYIEYPNPSFDVIKKFLRDYEKWNFEQQMKSGSSEFPNPTVTQDKDTFVLNYKIYVNRQPTGLPLDHVSTLNNSTKYWESQTFNSNKGRAVVKFSYTNTKADANIWITWTVRKLGEGVLGHAHVGKGVVEVALGDYNCDGSFQLYDMNSVEKIMRHELGHAIGLGHSNDTNSIMYPSMKPKYAYCLLN